MYKLDVIGSKGRGVGSDVEHLCLAILADNVEVELALRFGQYFPSLTHVKGLVLGSHRR